MKRIFTLLVAIILTAGAVMAASPQDILNKSAAKIRSSQSLTVGYTLTADGRKTDGAIIVSGNKFHLATPELMSWYDGKTQWTYSSQIGEVNITEPTSQEIQQVNPFSLVGNLSKEFKISSLKAPAGSKAVLLTPIKKRTDLRSAEVTVSDATLYPTRIILNLANGQRVTVNVTKVKAGGALPITEFRFNPKKHPELSVVDLR